MFRLYVAVHQKTLSIPGYAGTHQPDIYVVSLQVSHIHCHPAAIGRKRGICHHTRFSDVARLFSRAIHPGKNGLCCSHACVVDQSPIQRNGECRPVGGRLKSHLSRNRGIVSRYLAGRRIKGRGRQLTLVVGIEEAAGIIAKAGMTMDDLAARKKLQPSYTPDEFHAKKKSSRPAKSLPFRARH